MQPDRSHLDLSSAKSKDNSRVLIMCKRNRSFDASTLTEIVNQRHIIYATPQTAGTLFIKHQVLPGSWQISKSGCSLPPPWFQAHGGEGTSFHKSLWARCKARDAVMLVRIDFLGRRLSNGI